MEGDLHGAVDRASILLWHERLMRGRYKAANNLDLLQMLDIDQPCLMSVESAKLLKHSCQLLC